VVVAIAVVPVAPPLAVVVDALPVPPPVVDPPWPVAPEAPELVALGTMGTLSSAEQLMPTTIRQGSATDVARNIRFISPPSKI
jgi:hypothetical protein